MPDLTTALYTIISGLIVWLFAREKNRAEIKGLEATVKETEAETKEKELESIRTTLELYEKLQKMNTQKMEGVIEEYQKLTIRVIKLEKIISALVVDSCKVKTCNNRIPYGAEDISIKTQEVPDCITDVDMN